MPFKMLQPANMRGQDVRSRMIPTTAENQICGKVEEHQARRLSNNFDEPVPQVTFHLYMSVCAHVRMCVCKYFILP